MSEDEVKKLTTREEEFETLIKSNDTESLVDELVRINASLIDKQNGHFLSREKLTDEVKNFLSKTTQDKNGDSIQLTITLGDGIHKLMLWKSSDERAGTFLSSDGLRPHPAVSKRWEALKRGTTVG